MRGSSHDGRIYALPQRNFLSGIGISVKKLVCGNDRRYNTTTDLVEAQIGYSKFPFFLLAQQNGQWILMIKIGQ